MIYYISFKCNCMSWKHILAYDEEQAVYRCQRHFNSISLTFLTNVTAYHESISRHGMNNKQYIGVNDISTVSLTFLTNVTAYHESISWHETNNKQYIDVNDISTVSLTFLRNVAPYHEKHILAYDEEQAVFRCQRHFNSIIDISYKCNYTSWKHIVAWDE